jgi:hypothetical protein
LIDAVAMGREDSPKKIPIFFVKMSLFSQRIFGVRWGRRRFDPWRRLISFSLFSAIFSVLFIKPIPLVIKGLQ